MAAIVTRGTRHKKDIFRAYSKTSRTFRWQKDKAKISVLSIICLALSIMRLSKRPIEIAEPQQRQASLATTNKTSTDIFHLHLSSKSTIRQKHFNAIKGNKDLLFFCLRRSTLVGFFLLFFFKASSLYSNIYHHITWLWKQLH